MKNLKHTLLVVVAFGLVGMLTSTAQAQEKRRAAVQAYNSASELAKNNNYDQAIAKFEEAIEAGNAADQAGEKGADIVERAKEKLPAIYYDKALNAYRTFQSSKTTANLDATVAAFNEAASAGEQYGNSSIAQKSNGNVTQLMYSKSVLQYSQQNYKQALATIDQVIERNANYAKAYFHKGLIYKKMDGNFDNALAQFDKAIEVGESAGDSQIVRKAKENASEELVYRGATQTQEKNYSQAITYLNRALEYDSESANAYYRLAEAYNDRAEWDNALNNGLKAVELENGGRTTKAKIYFEIASAYKGKGNFSQACDAYANAAYGSFKSNAEHQMEYELKCNK